MKRALMMLVAGTILSGIAAYATTAPKVAGTPAVAAEVATH